MLSALVRAGAAPLTEPAAVQSQPDLNAPVLAILNPGTEPTPAAGPTQPLPPGWLAVAAPGPFDGYVRNADLTKQLEVKPGTSIRVAPKSEAGVLMVFGKGDKAQITGLAGAWTQVRLDQTLVGYIHLGPIPAASAAPSAAAGNPSVAGSMEPTPSATASAGSSAGVSTGGPMGSAAGSNAAPSATTAPTAGGQGGGPATAMAGQAYDSGDTSALPRTFEGVFVSTHKAFTPRRPYDWQVNDSSGQRYAYLDISHLLLTDQIENYAGHEVRVHGTARLVPGTKDLVIQIESLRLK
jgi:hypothetical protein